MQKSDISSCFHFFEAMWKGMVEASGGWVLFLFGQAGDSAIVAGDFAIVAYVDLWTKDMSAVF